MVASVVGMVRSEGEMEAYVHGVSTRSVDDLVTAMGVDSGVSKSEVDRGSAQVCGAVEMSCRSSCVTDHGGAGRGSARTHSRAGWPA